ncbi:MAG: hypothetical protein ACRYG8_01645 [Janthinobacterium lividum]
MPDTLLKRLIAYGAVAAGCLAVPVPANAAFDWVSIETLPGFDDARAQLQSLVDRNGHHRMNRFCVIGQKDGTHFQAEVYWLSENKLILWVPNINDAATLIHSRRYLDLRRDVRTNIGTSTYLLSKSFVAETLKACASEGEHFIIEKDMPRVPDHGQSCHVHQNCSIQAADAGNHAVCAQHGRRGHGAAFSPRSVQPGKCRQLCRVGQSSGNEADASDHREPIEVSW